MTNQNIFEKLYSERLWQVGSSLSGPGSDPENALVYVSYVEKLIEKFNRVQILDIGHGDWAMWPKDFFKNLDYVGIDVVKDLNEFVKKTYGSKNIQFIQLDASKDQLPDADLVLIKDVLMHLSNEDISKILQKLKKFSLTIICHDVLRNLTWIDILFLIKRQLFFSGRFKNLIRGKNPFYKIPQLENGDIISGSHRFLNLEKYPWSLKDFNLEIVETKDFVVLPPNVRKWKCICIKRIYLIRPNPDYSNSIFS